MTVRAKNGCRDVSCYVMIALVVVSGATRGWGCRWMGCCFLARAVQSLKRLFLGIESLLTAFGVTR